MRGKKLLIGGWLLAFAVILTPLVQAQAAEATIQTATTTAKTTSLLTNFKELSVKKETSTVKIDVAYPLLTKLLARQTINNYISKTISSFQKENPSTVNANKNELNITYTTFFSGNLVSVVFQVYTYTGGAHGATNYKIFNFNWNNGLTVKNTEVFKGDTYLRTITDAVRPILEKQLITAMEVESLDRDSLAWLFDGTAPVDSNYSNYYFDDGKIMWIFGQYQVAPYAYGIFTVDVPIIDLAPSLTSNILKILKLDGQPMRKPEAGCKWSRAINREAFLDYYYQSCANDEFKFQDGKNYVAVNGVHLIEVYRKSLIQSPASALKSQFINKLTDSYAKKHCIVQKVTVSNLQAKRSRWIIVPDAEYQNKIKAGLATSLNSQMPCGLYGELPDTISYFEFDIRSPRFLYVLPGVANSPFDPDTIKF